VKLVDSKTALTLFFVFIVLPTPALLKAAGLWHHNDIALRMGAQILIDGALFLFLKYTLWKRLPDAEQRDGQPDEQREPLRQQ
jgi:hypothetical protein